MKVYIWPDGRWLEQADIDWFSEYEPVTLVLELSQLYAHELWAKLARFELEYLYDELVEFTRTEQRGIVL